VPRRILSVSRNCTLLLTRNDLLAVAGYSVASPREPLDAALLFSQERFDAVLIGDSVPSKERRAIIRGLRELRTDVSILYVYADRQYDQEPLADECVDVSGDPEPLLRAIERQINLHSRQRAA
jgi:DNA-binding response OmpR family regulator